MCMATCERVGRSSVDIASELRYRIRAEEPYMLEPLSKLSTVSVDISNVVEAPIQRVWQILSYFGDTHGYRVTVGQSRIPPNSEFGGGTCSRRITRTVYMGHGQFQEELTFLNQQHHALKGRLIQDESNVNPFPGRFLDYKFSYRLHKVSVSNSTLVRLQCTFKTDVAVSGIMQAKWEQIFLGIIQGLALHMKGSNRQQVLPAMVLKVASPGSQSPLTDSFSGSETGQQPSAVSTLIRTATAPPSSIPTMESLSALIKMKSYGNLLKLERESSGSSTSSFQAPM
eukprot:jgi/Botrbrau1/17213/Bobra.0620s0003.1